MLPKKGGSGFSNLNPSISIYKKQHFPGFFSIIFIKHDALRVFHHHQLEIGGYPPPNLRLEFSHHHLGQQPPTNPPAEGDARSLRSGRSGRSVRSVVETPTGSCSDLNVWVPFEYPTWAGRDR